MTNNSTRLLNVFFILLTASSTLMADQLSDISVFQPTKDVFANIYIDQNQLIIKTNETDQTEQQNLLPLADIKNDYITLYPNQLYILNDNNNDGLIEVSALKSVNPSLNEFCYSIFNYNATTKLYENNNALISCKKGNLEHTIDEQRNIANADHSDW